jgi:ferrous iron transport protein A
MESLTLPGYVVEVPLSPTLADAPPEVPVLLGVPQLPRARARRLAELGLRPGAWVTVLHRTTGGGRLIGIGQTRIALDRETSAALPVTYEGSA